jgi:hypothetical protein
MTFEDSLVGAQDLKLMAEGDVIQLLPLLQMPLPLLQLPLSLLQQPLQLLHLLRLLVDLSCGHGEVLLQLDDGAGPSFGRCMHLLRIGKGLLGVSVALGDSLHVQVGAMLPCPHRRPLRDHHPLRHAGPQLEALSLIIKVLTFAV